jgi:predicted nucleotidyltransferase
VIRVTKEFRLGEEPIQFETGSPEANFKLFELLRTQPMLNALQPGFVVVPMRRSKPSIANSAPEERVMNEDFIAFIRALNAAGARFLLIGGFAGIAHGNVRYTQDMDIWVEPTLENARRVLEALQNFGWLNPPSLESLVQSERHFRTGEVPTMIDMFTGVGTGFKFASYFERSITIQIADVSLQVLSLDDLITIKKYAGRNKDLADLDVLLAIQAQREQK